MNFFYLDGPGISGLFEQTINDVENEFDRLYRADPIGSLHEKTVLARRLGDLLGVDQLTTGGTFCRSRKYIDEIKAKLSVQNKTVRLLDYQRDVESAARASTLDLAIRRWRFGAANLICVHEHFHMPQFTMGQRSEVLVYASGFLEFELELLVEAGLGRRGSAMAATATLTREKLLVLMSANLSKFQNLRQGKMTPESPEAQYFHSFQGMRVPLHVLGSLNKCKDVFRIKPLALWR